MRRALLMVAALGAVVVIIVAISVALTTYRSTAQSLASGTYAPPTTVGSLSGVVATGTLRPAAVLGSASGRVTITADQSTGSFTVALADLKVARNPRGGQPNANLAAVAPTSNFCAPGGLTFGFGKISAQMRQSFLFPGAPRGIPGNSNPSYLRALTITQVNTASDSATCPYLLVAYAPLRWTIGDLRPDIRVADKGWRPGAVGAVVIKSGHPYSYKVVRGDNLKVIAARFKLNLDQLFYLNPARAPSPTDPVAHVGEVLNLSKNNR
jgi:hypothetical protein